MRATLHRKAQAEARQLLQAVQTRAVFAEDPEFAIRNAGFTIIESRVAPSDCSVAASYDEGPPLAITLTPTASIGRRNFSLCHEYAHYLIDRSWQTVRVLAAHAGESRIYLRETICDIVAAELLLPDELIQSFPNKGPSASDVIGLFSSQASREACCVRAAQAMRSEGYVMLADLDATARFTATARTVYRVRRDTRQPSDGAIARAAESGHYRGIGPVRFGSGELSPDHYVDARRDGRYVIGVFYSDNPPWERLSLGSPDSGSWAGDELECEHCEFVGVTYEPRCLLCGQRQCPECQHCGLDDDFRMCPGEFS